MLEVRGVEKSFGGRRALSDVSFDVAPGRMTGFIGGNGAGKTTTMRIILGVLIPDAGAVALDGRRLGPADRRRFGYMPEERGLYPKMRLDEQLAYLARLHGFGAAAAARSAAELIDRLGLAERARDDVEKLSLGNQQRAQIAAALVHRPEVLILDEPFSGLDPLGVDTVLGVLRERADAGAPVLFSSHQLDIVERLCDDVVIISGGEIRAAGDADALRDRSAGLRYRLDGVPERVAAGLVEGMPGVRLLTAADRASDDDTAITVEVDDDTAAQELLRRAVERGRVAGFARIRPSLAETYREVIA